MRAGSSSSEATGNGTLARASRGCTRSAWAVNDGDDDGDDEEEVEEENATAAAAADDDDDDEFDSFGIL